MPVQVKVVEDGTNVRLGGATKGRPDNLTSRVVDRGTYTARVQCAGEEVVEGAVRNNWWVYIDAPGGGSGWVSAARVAGLTAPGGNNEPIPGVPTAATIFPHPDELGHD